MKKSKIICKRIIRLCGVMAVLGFLSIIFALHLAFPNKYDSVIMAASKKYKIDDALIRAVIWTESKYKKDALSPKGATGLMQLLPSTAQFLAINLGYQAFEAGMLYDEEVNIDLGVYYLRYLFDKFGEERSALAAYNAGEGNVTDWQNSGLETIPFAETRDYITKVTTVKKIYHFKAR